jgi:glucose/arabinose dehydrogenase
MALPSIGASLSLALPLLCAPAHADLSFADFSLPFGVQFLGDAHVASAMLRLTNPASDERGAAWFTTAQRVSTAWNADFQFQLAGGPGADGFAFVIQNASTNELGAGGCELAYHGIANSIAVEFDTYANSGCSVASVNDLGAPHVSVHTLGTAPNSVSESASIGSTTVVPPFSNGAVHTARISYIPGSLLIYIDDLSSPLLAVPLDLPATLSLAGDQAWVGFTGATGGLSESHDILNFNFDEDATGGSGNSAPLQPTITEPAVDGQLVNPADVHLETSAFVDPDPSDAHACSDYEIWLLSPSERVWVTACARGVTKLHTHLADGVFENSHAGRTELLPGTQYLVRARHRDDSGDSSTEWSPWGQRLFQTGSASDIFPLVSDDIGDQPELSWRATSTGIDIVLPGGTTPPTLRLDNPIAGLLLELSGVDGSVNTSLNPSALSEHVDVRVQLTGGSSGLTLAESDLVVYDHDCERIEILLPPVNLAAGQTVTMWVAADGSTYQGSAGQTAPSFATKLRGLTLPWSVRQAGYEIEEFAGGLQLPVNIAFIPGAGPEPTAPFFYVNELYGTIRVVKRDGSVSTYASGLLDFNPTGAFPGSGEQGLAGLAVDPVSGDVFVSVLHDSTTNPGTHYPKVVRFHSNDGGLTAASSTVLLDMIGESQGQSHQISNVTLHPDGKLLVHMGDGFDASTAQNMDSYRGKILRMNLDGTPATDNPFYDAGNGINSRDYIWAYGVRNAFGGAWRALDGLQYTVENGPSVDRIGQVVAGRNFGWTGTNASMLIHAIYAWEPAHGPVNIAFIQPETFGGSGFPADKYDHAFVSESGPTYASGGQALGKRITEFVLDPAGDLVAGPLPFLEYAGSGKETAVGLAAGPDGLYMTSLYRDQGASPIAIGAKVYRISRTPGWDCNENGIDDACDLASGVESDANGNGLPDTCDCAGANFCASTVNSTGGAAKMSSNGQCVHAVNQLVLSAAPVPNGPGLFFFAPNQVAGGAGAPFYNGLRCVGPGVLRFAPTIAASGVASRAVDLSAAPASQIQPGQTWHFQYWFRDVAGGGTAVNLSDGLSLTFQ